MKRALLAVLILLPLAGLLASCTTIADQTKQQVIGYITATASQARAYTYDELDKGSAQQRTVVAANIADDLRYSMSATINGTPAASEVVVNDARALQVPDASLVRRLVASNVTAPVAQGVITTPGPAAAGSAASAASAIPAALMQGAWVLDPKGASRFAPLVSSQYLIGTDPLYDTLNVLNYVRDVVQQGGSVEPYNPEATDYRKDFDPFPAPATGVTRYDVVPPLLQTSSGHHNSIALTSLVGIFRRASIYVDNGVVVAYRESVDVASMLADPRASLADHLQQFGITLPPGTITQQARYLLQVINGAVHGGPNSVRERTLTVTFRSIGHAGVVKVPTDTVGGDLSKVGNHGLVLFETS